MSNNGIDYKQYIADRLIPILMNEIGISAICNQCIYTLIRQCKDRKFGDYQINVNQLLHKCKKCDKLNLTAMEVTIV